MRIPEPEIHENLNFLKSQPLSAHILSCNLLLLASNEDRAGLGI